MHLAMTETAQDPRWQSVRHRDATADGQFVYAVKTTGVYCRPSCAARPANPRNVSFYPTPTAAEAAGYRPCKRCTPNAAAPRERQAALIEAACRRIDAAEQTPSLDTLAAEAGLSPYHFHRRFKEITGLTPRAYAAARRAARVRAELADESETITEAIYGAGFNASSRFYEASNAMLGMTPSTYKRGGAGAEISFAIGECSLGSILVAQSDRGVCAILLGDDPDTLARQLQDRFPNATLSAGDPTFDRRVAEIVGFVDAPNIGHHLPLDIRGTAFQQRVWQALTEIPPGATISYAELARRIGQPKSVRAVAAACAANQLAVLIPCHRVVRGDGALAGYRWGVERKRALIEKEEGLLS